MKRPEISVVVPVCNTERYLEQCISSIINQTFEDFELICVDDGSTDNSLNVLKRYSMQDGRMSVIHRDKASGSAAVPRNIGLEHATGKYIVFLDSDDYFDSKMLEKMYGCAEEKQADLVMCDNYVVSSLDDSIKNCEGELHHNYIPERDIFSYKDIPDTIFQISNAAIWHKLILRSVLVCFQLRFQENVPILDDIYFVNLLLVLSKRIHILNEKLVFYREMRAGGQTTKIAEQKESIYLAFKKLNDFLISNNLYHDVKRSIQNWTIQMLEWWYYSVKERKTAFELFDLYKNDYFPKLKLMDIDSSGIYNGEDFYKHILYETYRPSIGVILNSISPYGVNIVIYGAGRCGKNVYKYIIRHEPQHFIRLWCDKNADIMQNTLIDNPKKIREIEFDVLIIAIVDEKIVLEVKNYLQNSGVNEGKIYTLI